MDIKITHNDGQATLYAPSTIDGKCYIITTSLHVQIAFDQAGIETHEGLADTCVYLISEDTAFDMFARIVRARY